MARPARKHFMPSDIAGGPPLAARSTSTALALRRPCGSDGYGSLRIHVLATKGESGVRPAPSRQFNLLEFQVQMPDSRLPIGGPCIGAHFCPVYDSDSVLHCLLHRNRPEADSGGQLVGGF